MSDFTYTAPEVSSVVGLIETYLRWKDMNGPDRGYEIYHPSAFGKCLRLMQYQRYEARGLIKGEKDPFEGRMLRLFGNGHVMHARWVKYFEELGILRGVWECQNPYCRLWNDDGSHRADAIDEDIRKAVLDAKKMRRYGEEELQGTFKPKACVCGCKTFEYHEVLVQDKELNFKGHCDIILDFRAFDPTMFDESITKGLNLFFQTTELPKGLVVVDMKSIGANQWERKLAKYGAHKYYQIQLTIYVHVLKCDFGILWYEQKDTFDQKAFQIPANDPWWQMIRKQALTMQEMAAGDRPLLPPPRPLSKTDMECAGYKGSGGCPYKKFCHKAGGIWDDPNLEQKRKDFYGDLL